MAKFLTPKGNLLFIILTLGLFINVHAQIKLARGHNPTKGRIGYIVDFLNLDSQLVQSIGFKRYDIKSAKVRDSTIVVTTKLLIVLNGKLLATKQEKKFNLARLNKISILSILKLEKEEAEKYYGKKGKRGALVVEINPCWYE